MAINQFEMIFNILCRPAACTGRLLSNVSHCCYCCCCLCCILCCTLFGLLRHCLPEHFEHELKVVSKNLNPCITCKAFPFGSPAAASVRSPKHTVIIPPVWLSQRLDPVTGDGVRARLLPTGSSLCGVSDVKVCCSHVDETGCVGRELMGTFWSQGLGGEPHGMSHSWPAQTSADVFGMTVPSNC
jgi:hypothetical protein